MISSRATWSSEAASACELSGIRIALSSAKIEMVILAVLHAPTKKKVQHESAETPKYTDFLSPPLLTE